MESDCQVLIRMPTQENGAGSFKSIIEDIRSLASGLQIQFLSGVTDQLIVVPIGDTHLCKLISLDI